MAKDACVNEEFGFVVDSYLRFSSMLSIGRILMKRAFRLFESMMKLVLISIWILFYLNKNGDIRSGMIEC